MKGETRLSAQLRFTLSRKIMDSRFSTAYMRSRTAYDHTRYTPRCDVVVDGFPRSANTYVWYALKASVEPKYVVRGHTHAASTLKAAVAAEKPVMLLVREPDGAVSSLYQLLNGVSLESCLNSYARFYTQCYSLKRRLYIAEFNDVINDFGAVSQDFYDRFGLDWPAYHKNEANEFLVNDAIEYANRRRNLGEVREAGIARPSAHRKSAEEVMVDLSKREHSARERARRAYHRLVG